MDELSPTPPPKKSNISKVNKQEEYNFKLWQDGIKEVANSINKFIDVQFKHDYKAQWIFVLITLIVFGAIIILAIMDKIEESTTGTLLGAAIGYSIGKYTHSKNPKE